MPKRPADPLAAARAAFWAHPFIPDTPVAAEAIYGMANVKRAGEEFLYGLAHWDDLVARGRRPPRGILFAGMPGVGKTLNALRIATAADAAVFNVRAFPLEGGMLDETAVAALFAGARAHARVAGRAVLLLWEEIDAHLIWDAEAPGKDPVAAALDAELDGLHGVTDPVAVVATANGTDGIHPTVIRAGRLLLAECHPLAPADARRLLVDRLALAGLPVPPEAHIACLLDGYICPADVVQMVEMVALRAALGGTPPTTATVGRLLVEQRFPIVDDGPDPALEAQIAWHELGHALVGSLLDLDMTAVNVLGYSEQGGAVWFVERGVVDLIDSFAMLVVTAAGRAMEERLFGTDAIIAGGAESDMATVTRGYCTLALTAGGLMGDGCDTHALKEAMAIATDRMRAIDDDAHRFVAAVVATARAVLALADDRAIAALTPLHDRLIAERVILGADAADAIEVATGLARGDGRALLADAWQELKRALVGSTQPGA